MSKYQAFFSFAPPLERLGTRGAKDYPTYRPLVGLIGYIATAGMVWWKYENTPRTNYL